MCVRFIITYFCYLNGVVTLPSAQAQRPTPIVTSGIGSWLTCLEAMGYLATLTNWCARHRSRAHVISCRTPVLT
jgi:hypothetical protein